MHNARVHARTILVPNQKRESRYTEKTRDYSREWKRRQRAKLATEGLTSRGLPRRRWSASQSEKFSATMAAKKKERIQIVYPDPREEVIRNKAEDEREAQSVVIPTLRHCPNCGEHLAAWRYQP